MYVIQLNNELDQIPLGYRVLAFKGKNMFCQPSVRSFFYQDFETNQRLKNLAIEFLEDILCTPTLLPSEHRAASQLLRSAGLRHPWL
jgi:hypothetical protein